MNKFLFALAMCAALAVGASGQTPNERRIVPFPGKRLVDVVRPGDRHVVVLHPSAPPQEIASPTETAFAAPLTERSAVIIVARIVEKRPVFLDLERRRVFTPVPLAQANWIGSSIEMRIERIVKDTSGNPLQEGGRLAYIEDSDGSAIINGTRVDTETYWLRPIEVGRRYIMTGSFTDRGFFPEGTWEEPAPGLSLRRMRKPSARRAGDLVPPDEEYPSAFGGWNVEETLYWLQVETEKRTPR